MAFGVKIKEKQIFWTGKEDAVWSDDQSQAYAYSTLSDAKLAIGTEIPEYYELETVELVEEVPAE
jgi:hypothetical protein